MDGQESGKLTRFLRAYDPDQHIFHEGEPGDVMYVVHAGSVDIRKQGPRDTVQLATLSKGDLFGEMALIDRSPRSASANAGPQGAKLLAIDSAHFVYLVSQQPAFALVVLEAMALRLRSHNDKLGACHEG